MQFGNIFFTLFQALKTRVVPQIRALVVLPLKDLAMQVFKVFLTYCKGTPLKVVLVTGETSFQREQNELVRRSK